MGRTEARTVLLRFAGSPWPSSILTVVSPTARQVSSVTTHRLGSVHPVPRHTPLSARVDSRAGVAVVANVALVHGHGLASPNRFVAHPDVAVVIPNAAIGWTRHALAGSVAHYFIARSRRVRSLRRAGRAVVDGNDLTILIGQGQPERPLEQAYGRSRVIDDDEAQARPALLALLFRARQGPRLRRKRPRRRVRSPCGKA